MSVITIVGMASNTTKTLDVTPADLEEILLYWLRGKGITIASSCDGEGVCKKCSIQNGWLTCELTLETFFKRQPDGKIFVGYL